MEIGREFYITPTKAVDLRLTVGEPIMVRSLDMADLQAAYRRSTTKLSQSLKPTVTEFQWIGSDEDSAPITPKTVRAVPLAPTPGRRRIRLDG